MHVRFLNMESYLIIGLMLFIYSTLVQTTNRDDFIKELTAGIIDGVSEKHEVEDNRLQKDTTVTTNSKGQSSTRRNAVEMKKEIIDAFVNLLYDKLQQKTKDEMLKKELANEITEEKEKKALPTLESIKSEKPGIWGREVLRGPPGLWGKKEMMNENDKQFHELNDRIYGPPGLWGRDIIDTSRHASDVGPPGLWGREVTKNDQEEHESAEKGPPGLWGREVESQISNQPIQDKRLHKKDN